TSVACLSNIIISPSLLQTVPRSQWQDRELRAIWNRLQNGEQLDGWSTNREGFSLFSRKLVVANDPNLQEIILTEAHKSRFVVHLGSDKMYRDLKRLYWWKGMKKDIATFVAKCLTCQRVKAEYQRLVGLLLPLPISK
ncbi:hypothetical protein PanWU01x14_069670, partial [Parasponia andersonii]